MFINLIARKGGDCMELIKMRGIEKYFGGKLLFTFDKLTVFKNDIIGVVGLNGSGKTTLLEIINNDIAPDKGNVEVKGDISYYKQFGQYHESVDSWQLKEFRSSSNVYILIYKLVKIKN